jgi:hypothetical protein
MRKLVVLVLVALGMLLLMPAAASASTPTLRSLAKSLTALQKTVKSQTAQIKALRAQVAAKHTVLTGSGAPAATLGASGDLYLDTATYQIYGPKTSGGWGSPTALQGPKGDTGATGAQGAQGDTGAIGAQGAVGATGPAGPDPSLNPAYGGLFALAPYVSVDQSPENGVAAPNIIFQGANVHVRSSNIEEDNNGTGNLIVGWDEPGYGARTGNNNLVCGNFNTFTANGCFIAGVWNTVGGLYSSISGGQQNTASINNASVSGGRWNAANGYFSSVSGGNAVTENSDFGWSAGGTFHNP